MFGGVLCVCALGVNMGILGIEICLGCELSFVFGVCSWVLLIGLSA